MKKITISKSRIILFLCLISSMLTVKAQNGDNFIASSVNGYYFNPQNIGLSTPQASDFMTYGNLDINHYNGLLNMEIELDGYKDNDFNLPMSIKYVSSGFTPSKRPSLVGYNWFLNFGGIITRTVKGSPDETKGNYENKSDKYLKDGLLVAMRNNTYVNYSNQSLTGFQMPRTSNSKVPYLWGDFKHDFEPDIFQFSFGSHSGSFIIGNDGNPVSLSGKGYKVDITGLTIQEYSTTNAPQSSTIKITTPDGFLYEFGGNTTYLEYSIPNNPEKTIQKPRQILSWYLKSIKAPNQRTVTFTYQSKLLPNSYTYLLYLKFNMYITAPPSLTDAEISKQITMRDKVYSPVISEVAIDNGTTIKFNTTTGPTFYDGGDTSIRLSKISHQIGTTTIKETELSYLTKGKYYFLQQLNKNAQIYSFEYNLPATLPSPLTLSTDQSGFWNGGTVTTLSDSEVKTYCMNADNNKKTSGAYYNVALLSKVTYPTKGRTEIIYEQNTYDRYMDRSIQLEQIGIYHTTSTPCGGSRVKEIKDYDVATSQTVNRRTFQYIIPQTGKGSGILGNNPKYRTTELIRSDVMGGYPYSMVTNTDAISTNSVGYNQNLTEYHIGYSDILEHRSDGSYTHYQYTSNANMPNSMSGTTYSILMGSYRDLEVREKNGMYIANDLSAFRGKLSEKKHYNSSKTLVQTERYIYNTDLAQSSYNTSVATTPRGPASYRIYLTPCLLKKKEVTDANGITQTANYQYNSYSLVSEEKTTNSDSKEFITKYSYPTDYLLSELGVGEKLLFNKNILAKPLTIKKVTPVNGVDKTLESLQFTYKTENNLPVLDNIKRLEGSTWKTIMEYPRYDNYGNPMHVIENGSLQYVYLWSYKGQHLVAQITNASYTDVNTKALAAGLNLSTLTALSTPADSDFTKLNTLRTSIPKAQVTIYKYKPLIGIETITDGRNFTTYYDYDLLNRLKKVYIKNKNGDKKTLETYQYNYVNR